MKNAYSFISCWLYRNVLPGILICIATIGLVWAGGEVYFRITTPFFNVQWPSYFNPAHGFLFEPGSEIRWTNHVDFWTTQRANTLGFLDREPERNPDACHIAIIGDSFIEAAQVPIEDKIQVQLETLANKNQSSILYSSSAFGYSGTGQLNQIPFYQHFASQQKSDLMVLVFVGNDFRNNSAILESIANGWHPDHLPRVFAKKHNDHYSLTEIDPDWSAYLLKTGNSPVNSFRSTLAKNSQFFNWISNRATQLYPDLFGADANTKSLMQTYKQRFELLSTMEEYRQIMSDWDYDGNLWAIDNMFHEENLPQVFHDALGASEFALAQFKRMAETDGSKLVILAASQLSGPYAPVTNGRKIGQARRLKDIASNLDIPVIDQQEYVLSIGGDPKKVSFPNDGHWSKQGHLWAAEALWNYIAGEHQLCLDKKT